MRILVTGANRGLGREVVRQLAEAGHDVIMTSRNPQRGRVALEEVKAETANSKISQIILDVSNMNSVDRLFSQVSALYNSLDVLINNAGILPNSSNSSTVSLESLKSAMDTNVYGALQVTQSLLPLLKKSNNARIINVSSGMGALENMGGGHAAYRMSKTALNSLTAMMAVDLSPFNIKVFAVCPGWVRTDMGGMEAPRSLEAGAQSITYLVTALDAVSGKFYRDGDIIPW
jgi:NAD(P)-dependent dehydrogenase (short-subunit alcohol dehydrogenase family)